MRLLNIRGDSSTNVILFLVVIIAALIIVTWYASSVRPTRYIIGATTHDLDELNQHFANACTASVYRSTYVLKTQGAVLSLNGTQACITSEVFSSCTSSPCGLEAANISLGQEPTLVFITRDAPASVRVHART